MPTPSSAQVALVDDLNRALRPIGRVPRVMSVTLAAFSIGLSALVFSESGNVLSFLVGVPATVVAFLSFRIRACADEETLVVRSYLRTTTIRLRDVQAFVDLEYIGFWNLQSGGNGWTNLWLRMLDYTRTSGHGRSLPETMCTRRRGAEIAALLNSYLDAQEMAWKGASGKHTS